MILQHGHYVARPARLSALLSLFHVVIGRPIGSGLPRASREELIERLLPSGLGQASPVPIRQCHGTRILSLQGESLPSPCEAEPADGVITDRKGVLLQILTADCVPLCLVDPRRPALGLVHIGWRGLAAGIVENAVTMFTDCGSSPSDLLALAGPSIGPCCYEVGGEVVEAFGGDVVAWGTREGCLVLDLYRTAADRLVRAGLKRGRIGPRPTCTRCHRRCLFSHRAGDSSRNIALALLLP